MPLVNVIWPQYGYEEGLWEVDQHESFKKIHVWITKIPLAKATRRRSTNAAAEHTWAVGYMGGMDPAAHVRSVAVLNALLQGGYWTLSKCLWQIIRWRLRMVDEMMAAVELGVQYPPCRRDFDADLE